MTLSLGSLGIAYALLSAAPKAERRVVLEVDHTPLLEQQIAEAAEETLFFVRGDSTELLREQHGVVAQQGADPALDAIIVRLSWIDYEESQYRVVVATRHPGEQARVVEEFECECVGSQLVGAILQRLPAAVEQLDEQPEPAVVEVQSQSTEPEQGGATPSEPEPVERRPLGVLGKAGIGVGAAGAVGLVAGGVVFSRGKPLDEPAGGGQFRSGSDFETPGIAVMVTGGVALLTGVALLLVDRAPAKGRGRSAALLPTPGGVVLSGRF